MTGHDRTREAVAVVLLLSLLALFGSLSEGYSIGPNHRNVSVDTKANITNAQPEILDLTVTDPITLNAGGLQTVECNVSLRDWNGGDTIDTVNATFFHSSSTLHSADDNNTHYTNSSCSSTSVNDVYANYTCTFDVYYYAEPDTWNCSVFVNDTASFAANDTKNTTVNTLYALNVTNPIDYGDLAIQDTSANKTADVTNFGNVPINISVYGYGQTPGDGLAMVCAEGNISIENEKYSVSITDDYAAKDALSGTQTQIPGLTMSKQTTPARVVNTTYWQLFVPPNPFGVCNGTVVFQAESS